MKKNHFYRNHLLLVMAFFCCGRNAMAQKIDTGRYRVKTELAIPFKYLGTVVPRSTAEISSSNWLIGCETMDRDFTDYDSFKEYIAPLGIKLLRMQAGWDKTEKVKGVYDWAWLDHIINDAVQRGFKPWLQTSYGNHNYPGGGGSNLGAGVPHSDEALKAWDKWVTAMVMRYKGKVKDWEVWNEPNFADNEENTADKAALLNIRTAEIIKRIQPEARISGLALGHISLPYADLFFKTIADKGKMNLFDNMTYHDYVYNPDSHYPEVESLRRILDKYAPHIKLRQGENGAPSEGGAGRGALGDYNWTELSQAKWDTRRMLGDLGHDIETSVFGLIEMAYTSGPIHRLNYKGIIKSDSTKKAIRPKIAYYAIQNVTSIFDHSLERIKGLHATYNKNILKTTGEPMYSKSTDRSLAVYGYRNATSGKQVYSIWQNETIPLNENILKKINISFSNADFDQPVFVDIITGGVFEIPASQWSKDGKVFTFTDIPVYDAPILLIDKSLVKFR
ncbi:GH39 family glycosyl hydrolase [Flavitalea antarctica]